MITQNKSWVAEANLKVQISDVLTSLGIYVPEGLSNKKIHCPFGFYHSDNGLAKAMRVYTESNTVYCFSCSKRYSCVSLAAAAWDCSYATAAFRLLEGAGIKPKTLEERWAYATTQDELKPDLMALADALKIYCTRFDSWGSLQYTEQVAKKFSACLEILEMVKTDDDASAWLNVSKQAMSKTLQAAEISRTRGSA